MPGSCQGHASIMSVSHVSIMPVSCQYNASIISVTSQYHASIMSQLQKPYKRAHKGLIIDAARVIKQCEYFFRYKLHSWRKMIGTAIKADSFSSWALIGSHFKVLEVIRITQQAKQSMQFKICSYLL